MDPLTALGLAASVVQFLDFSGKLVSGAFVLYKSVDGATSLNSCLEHIARDLSQLCNKMGAEANAYSHRPFRPFIPESEAALVPLVKVRLDTFNMCTQVKLSPKPRSTNSATSL